MDGTLAESKSAMEPEMASLIVQLLRKKMVAVISGGRYEQFEKQFVSKLVNNEAILQNLFLFPTTSTSFYRYEKKSWRKVYAHTLSRKEKKNIMAAFGKAFKETGYVHPKKLYGKVIEDRSTQITFSAVGQRAPVKVKEEWFKNDQRPRIMRAIKKHLKGFEVRAGGLTSIDVTRKGIDKAYGIRQIEKQLKVSRKHMLFVGDAIYPGGNDYAALRTGVDYVKVKDPEDTKKLIRKLIRS